MFSSLRNHPWRTFLAVAFLAASAAGAWTLSVRWRARSEYRAALRALDEHDLEGARAHLDRCLRLRPENADALLLAARSARRAGDHAEAERRLTALEARRQLPEETALERLLAAAQEGNLTEVEDELRRMVTREHPRTPLILEALAQGYLITFQIPYALDSLDLLLQRQPDDFSGWLLRGRGLEVVQRDEEAAADYERAVALAPRSVEARLALAEVLRRLGRTREAVAHYECLRRLRPDHARGLLGLAICRFDLGQQDEACRLFDALLGHYPDYIAALVERGRLAYRAGRAAEGEKDLRLAFALTPTDPDVLRVLLLCLEGQGKVEEADRLRARVNQVETDLVRFFNIKIKLQQETPRDPDLYCEAGRVLLRLHREEEARRWFLGALQCNPSHAPTHLALANYCERSGRPEEARRHRAAARRKGKR